MPNESVLMPFEVIYNSESSAILALMFIDTTNGKKYKIQVTNGVIEAVEVI